MKRLGDFEKRYGDFYTPRFRIQVGESRFAEADGVVSDVSVESTLDGADSFSFTLHYPFEHEASRFRGLSWEAFAPRTPVTIWLGYGNLLGPDPQAKPEVDPLLTGRIASVKPEFPADGAPAITVSGFDLLHDMTRGTDSDSWNDKTDSDVVSILTSKYELNFPTREVTATGVPREKIIQDKESDYAVLKRLADTNRFELFARLDTLYFRPPPRKPDPNLTLTYGDSLRSFSPERNDAEQVGEVEIRHWDPGAKKEIVGKATRPDQKGKTVLRRAVDSKAQADILAEAALADLTEGEVTGSGETVGLPDLRVGEWVTLEIGGFDETGKALFDGDYYVQGVSHRLGGSGYTTSFSVTGTVI